MKPKVYLETSIISYLTARPSGNVIAAGHQFTTLDWWQNERRNFDLFVSELVVREAGRGDAEMAAKRLEIIDTLKLVAVTGKAVELAKILVSRKVVPGVAAADALHIAIAAVEKIDFLATWNFKHIANARMQVKIEEAIKSEGFSPSKICTLEELTTGVKVMKEKQDEIIKETRRLRDEYAKQFGYDLDLIFKDLQKHQKEESGRKYVSLSGEETVKRPKIRNAA